jgi:hypothetical protein
VISQQDEDFPMKSMTEINSPERVNVEVDLWVDVKIPYCDGLTLDVQRISISPDEIELYRRDPDQFAAEAFDLTKDEYREWCATFGRPLCGEKTKSGRLCRQIIAGGRRSYRDPAYWKAHHRNFACCLHSRAEWPPRKHEEASATHTP